MNKFSRPALSASRFEFKYLMNEQKAISVLSVLKKLGMRPDPKSCSGGDNSYIVSSLYFDSWAWKDYQDKVGGFLSRKKIRLRFYGDEPKDIWAEIKRKQDMSILKERSHEIKKPLLMYIIKEGLKPKVLVRYKRRPLVFGNSNNLRITFDSNIETCKTSSFFYNKSMFPVGKGLVVMELKYNICIPRWFGDIVKKFDLQREAFSKYALSVEVCNKYKPLVR
ncbi:polyphosphate polymerase domain-containing protein [Patescibacteria group bacterium]